MCVCVCVWSFLNNFLCVSMDFKMFFSEGNSAFPWQTKFCFWWKTKNDKSFGFEISKSSKKQRQKNILCPPQNFFLSIFLQFQLLIEFSIFIRFNAYTVYFLHFAPIFQKLCCIEVGQLHFGCFPDFFQKTIWRKWLVSEKLFRNRQNEVDQLQL